MTAFYLYCVVRRARRPAMDRAPKGLSGASNPVAIACGRGLWCVGADVPLTLYGPARIEAGLRDLEWVSRVAVAHESVVEFFARDRGATVVPMKLFTMFSTREKAADGMRPRAAELRAILKRIAGCQEWGIRITPAARPTVETSNRRSVASGTEFLSTKKALRDRTRAAAQAAASAAEDAFRSLTALARAVRRQPPPQGAERPPIVHAALLVPVAARARFASAVKRATRACRSEGAELTLTGPWPAYNFIQEEGRR